MERIMLPVLMLLASVVVSQGVQTTVYWIRLYADGSALLARRSRPRGPSTKWTPS